MTLNCRGLTTAQQTVYGCQFVRPADTQPLDPHTLFWVSLFWLGCVCWMALCARRKFEAIRKEEGE